METTIMGALHMAPDAGNGVRPLFDRAAACRLAQDMVAAGADIIEIIGAPDRRALEDSGVEQSDVLNVVEALAGDVRVCVAVRSEQLARAAIKAGATLISEVVPPLWSAGETALYHTAAETGVAWLGVHSPGATPRIRPSHGNSSRRPADGSRGDGSVHGVSASDGWGEDGTGAGGLSDSAHAGVGGGADSLPPVVGEVVAALEVYAERAQRAGVEEFYVDPGIGLGATSANDLVLLANLDRLVALGRPLVVGASPEHLIDELHAAADTVPGVPRSAAPGHGSKGHRAAPGHDSGDFGVMPSSAGNVGAANSGAGVVGAAGSGAGVVGAAGSGAGNVGALAEDRLEGALALAVWAMLAGAAVVRTPYVAATLEAARVVGAKPPVGALA